MNLMCQQIKHLLTNKGKKARWRSSFLLNPDNDFSVKISSLKTFHSFSTLLLKENLATASLTHI